MSSRDNVHQQLLHRLRLEDTVINSFLSFAMGIRISHAAFFLPCRMTVEQNKSHSDYNWNAARGTLHICVIWGDPLRRRRHVTWADCALINSHDDDDDIYKLMEKKKNQRFHIYVCIFDIHIKIKWKFNFELVPCWHSQFHYLSHKFWNSKMSQKKKIPHFHVYFFL